LAALAVALGALAAVAVVRLRSSASWERSTKLYGSGFRPYQGQMLFTLNDFKTGRVSFPSQNLANGQGVPEPVSPGGPEHSHVLWGNGFRPYIGGQKLFSIDDFDSGRVSFPEEASRGVRQVVKSNDVNIEPAGSGKDHIWGHQTSHGPIEYQDWPLEMPGVGDGVTTAAPGPAFPGIGMKSMAPTTQLSAVTAGSRVQKQFELSTKLDRMQRQAALSLERVGNELEVAATQMLTNTGMNK
jgi:hypothetical protein